MPGWGLAGIIFFEDIRGHAVCETRSTNVAARKKNIKPGKIVREDKTNAPKKGGQRIRNESISIGIKNNSYGLHNSACFMTI